ncbi:Rossmann-fold superfamily protein [Perilla frutescens var. hirtella]|uniref:Short-chain dehydrogenase/reductase n=1 Tax=Perilla frutescens var. hirtella TaxID=608512 RepID=A0AAD4JQ80_PERFH|nr:Rossmann-fold superfamily protein [Perilla frutescens var. hirtella]KAH6817880.1 Rossmann-fold superfamily protein [Perilla frutescens var. frutescens]KAH6838049.1 Rossmann-fold superfamily protein [Perilla frutescens var. hirtella]
MADAVVQPATQRQRYALITGANKGIGFEICRQLASKGIVVILASRDEKRGIEAQHRLKEEFHDYVVFHQLDVVDSASVAAAVEFIKTKFGRLDILVNNAGIRGVDVDGDVSLLQEYIEADGATFVDGGQAGPFHPKASGRLIETLKGAEECIETNYYAVKTITEALIPLLQLSPSPRIVNVSSTMGSLVFQPNEWAKGVLSSEDGLTEDRVDEVVQEFLKDFKNGLLEENHWPSHLAAYKVSKAALNAYTRLIAKKNPSFIINCVCPGYVRTNITNNSGLLSEAEGAEAPVKLALLPDGGPSGSFFHRMEALSL